MTWRPTPTPSPWWPRRILSRSTRVPRMPPGTRRWSRPAPAWVRRRSTGTGSSIAPSPARGHTSFAPTDPLRSSYRCCAQADAHRHAPGPIVGGVRQCLDGEHAEGDQRCQSNPIGSMFSVRDDGNSTGRYRHASQRRRPHNRDRFNPGAWLPLSQARRHPACPPLTRKRRLARRIVSNQQEGVKNMTTKSCVMAVLVAVVALTSLSWARSPADLNDLEIAYVAYTADTIDIRHAHLALAISDNPQVRAF